MHNPFTFCYHFFRNNRPFFILFLMIICSLIFIPASRIRFEEDISRMTGGNDTVNRFEYVTSHHPFAEKLIIRFALKDSTQMPDPGQLASVAAAFTDSLHTKFDSVYIREIRGNVQDSLIMTYMDFFYDHLPLYLDEKDYQKINDWLNKDSIDQIMGRNYRNLVTPAGFAMKKNIIRDPFGFTYLALKKLQSLQAGDNFTIFNGFIFTKDYRNLLLMVTPANPPGETSKNAILVSGMEEILKKVTSGTGVTSDFFGAAAMATGNAERLKKDIMLSLSIALFLIVLLVGWYFRSIKIPLLGFLPAAFGGGFALAVLYVFKGSISTIAIGIGSVILGLIVDYALYLVTRFRKTKNISNALADLTPAILLCALTSAGAFLCLIFLRSSVLHDLGWFAALSVAGAALFSLLILPQLLSEKDAKEPKKANVVDRVLAYPFDRNIPLIFLVLIMIVTGGFFMKKAGFVKDMMSMNYVTPKLALAQQHLERITNVSLKNVYVVSTGKDLESALKENERSEKLLDKLKKEGHIVTLSGTGDLLLSDSLQQLRLARWETFWSPGKRHLAGEMLTRSGKKYGFKPGVFSSFDTLTGRKYKVMDESVKLLLGKLFLSDFIHPTDKMVMITSIAQVKENDKTAVHAAFTKEDNPVVFDRQQLTTRFIAGVKQDFELLVNLSMLFVTLLLLISLGRIELAFLSALPMYASWVITLGFMGITGITFNIFNIIISSFIFGLGVDYSILMMQGLRNGLKYGHQDLSSYKVSVFLSGLTTLIGVAALFFARHPALNSIALISAAGIVSVILVTFTLQPFLFRVLFTERARRGRFPVTFRVFVKTVITWNNIILIALLMVVIGLLLYLAPLPRRRKEYCFHYLFSKLSKLYIAITFPTNRKLINPEGEDFKKPSIIISNHQSLIETPAFLRLHPKILILTNDWVWNSPLFGPIARMASFFNADHGLDLIMDKLQEKVNDGYSVLIFPEAHRSGDGNIQRFHRGAFYLAEKLNLDILPVVVFGSGDFLGKNAIWGRPNPLIMKILPRISVENTLYGQTLSEKTRCVRKMYRLEYEKLKNSEATPHYYRKKLILNYVLKGPVLEWYLRVKMKLANNYEVFDQLIPKEGKIIDLGCGYGYISCMLMMTSDKRIITGVDYDEEKIRVAQNGFLINDRLSFVCDDIAEFPISTSSGFLLSDVLHYLTKEKQEALLHKCIENLDTGGIIVIRDADSANQHKHKSSKLTEFLSTRVIKFNKTAPENKTLTFTSAREIEEIAGEYGLGVEIIQESIHTSNILMVIRK